MATSRDDFVIAIRSAFLKKSNKQRFSLVALIIFSVVLIVLSRINFPAINYLKIGLNEVVYRVSFIVSLPEQQLNRSLIVINNHLNLYNDHDQLKEKFKSLRGKELDNEYLKFENERLRKIIDEYIINTDELVAKVLLDKESPFLRSIILNKGSKDKIRIGMAVLDGPYLVGKVVEVNYATSRVLLISDLNSKIPVILEPGDIQSIMSGSGKNKGQIQYFKTENTLNEKKIVFTSGSGGIFKSGIPIGEFNSGEEIKFFSDLSQLTFVKVVSFNKENN
ncbi:rod shape-determining protein MreC [Candidatus Pelagibacter sp.]|nr:rod shape-determining protein MreC [Candidatus Pelagibacter sp.]